MPPNLDSLAGHEMIGRVTEMAHRTWCGWGVAGTVALALAAGCSDAGEETAPPGTVRPGTSTPIATLTVAPSPPPAPTAPPIATERIRPWLVPASTAARVVEPAANVFDAVVVAFGQSIIEPNPTQSSAPPGLPQWWIVLDLQNGAMIEGSSRVLVEMADDEVGCDDNSMLPFQLNRGELVSFELAAGEPGPTPEYWMTNVSSTFDGEPAVRGQRFEAEVCADRTPPTAI
jgi:hypothetical protein